ncbi:hypothetical protein B5S33_g5608 [[Candida] boidinii]|nr:hypothetical protein B5S30_g5501 [[Candida] boidinii]OWB86885.1 hypothetical protein B5S33_g5608 [[Candida] boidinii]
MTAQEGNSTSANVKPLIFQTKTIHWKDSNDEYHMNNILLQDNNGPCFIISFVNCLVLKYELINDLNTWTVVTNSKNKQKKKNYKVIGSIHPKNNKNNENEILKIDFDDGAYGADNDDDEEVKALILSENDDSDPIEIIAAKEKAKADLIDCIKTNLVSLRELLLKKHVSFDSILNCLINILMNINESKSKSTSTPIANISEIIDILPTLNSGLNINLEFNNQIIDDFDYETVVINKLLDIFDIQIYHGFKPNLTSDIEREIFNKFNTFDRCQDFLIQTIDDVELKFGMNLESISEEYLQKFLDEGVQGVLAGDLGNNDTQQTIENNYEDSTNITEEELKDDIRTFQVIKRFLSENPTQLTNQGLNDLKNDTNILRNNSISIFFRNDHFNTIFKKDDNIYLLVNDLGFLNTTDIVWQSINSLDGSTDDMLNGYFEPSQYKGKIEKEVVRKSANDNRNRVNLADFADGAFNGSGSGGGDDDELLAAQLQEEEDERSAMDLSKSYHQSGYSDMSSTLGKSRYRSSAGNSITTRVRPRQHHGAPPPVTEREYSPHPMFPSQPLEYPLHGGRSRIPRKNRDDKGCVIM